MNQMYVQYLKTKITLLNFYVEQKWFQQIYIKTRDVVHLLNVNTQVRFNLIYFPVFKH